MIDETKKNPDEAINSFISVMNGIVLKVKNNTATVSDYENFEEMMKMLGVPPEMIKESLTKNSFNSWKDYYEERKKNENDKNIYAIQSVEGAIGGLSSAAIEVLNKILRGDEIKKEKELA